MNTMTSLEQFITNNGLSASLIEHPTPVRTVEEALQILQCSSDNIIKSLLVKAQFDGFSDFFLVLVQGDRRIHTKKLKMALNAKDVKLASPQEVKSTTKYNIGDVPPISVPIPTIVDERILMKESVYAGGGAPNKNIHLLTKEMIELIHPLIGDVSKPIKKEEKK